MTRITLLHHNGKRIIHKIFTLLFIFFAMIAGQSVNLDKLSINPGECAMPAGCITGSGCDSYLSANIFAMGNYSMLNNNSDAFPLYYDEYASDEDEYYANQYKGDKIKYGIMTGVFGVLSATSVILMSNGTWEKRSTSTSVSINATDPAAATGLIMALVSFPMTIYSLIRFGVSASKCKLYGFSNPRLQPEIAYNIQDNIIKASLNAQF